MKEKDLKNCPFCNSKNIEFQKQGSKNGDVAHILKCMVCLTKVRAPTVFGVKNLWNTRYEAIPEVENIKDCR